MAMTSHKMTTRHDRELLHKELVHLLRTLSKTKEMLDDMHKRKIDMADAIYVINVEGYIGESTKSEIEYAQKHGKEVRYLVEPVRKCNINEGTAK